MPAPHPVWLLALLMPAVATRTTPPLARPLPPLARAVLWDLDGTLCDSFRLAFDATQEVLLAHGHAAISEAVYHECTRYTTPDRFARHAGLLPADEAFLGVGRELGDHFDALYIARVSTHTAPLFEATAQLALRLAAAGVPMALLTNAAVEYAEAVLTVHGLRHAFAVVNGADSVPAAKPRPDGLIQCLAQLSAQGLLGAFDSSCLGIYIGDSPSDGEAARLAGLFSVGVAWGSHPLFTLERCGHFDEICVTESDLLRLLLPDSLSDPLAPPPPAEQAVLIDRDGVLNEDVGHPGVLELEQLSLLPAAAPVLALLAARGHPTALVTNQKVEVKR